MSRANLRLAMSVAVVAVAMAGACHSGESVVSTGNSSSIEAASVEDALGFWRVVAKAEKGDCLIALNRLPVGDDFGVHVESCSLAKLGSAAAWRPVDGGFELLNGEREAIASFRKDGPDAFVATDEGFMMERAPLA